MKKEKRPKYSETPKRRARWTQEMYAIVVSTFTKKMLPQASFKTESLKKSSKVYWDYLVWLTQGTISVHFPAGLKAACLINQDMLAMLSEEIIYTFLLDEKVVAKLKKSIDNVEIFKTIDAVTTAAKNTKIPISKAGLTLAEVLKRSAETGQEPVEVIAQSNAAVEAAEASIKRKAQVKKPKEETLQISEPKPVKTTILHKIKSKFSKPAHQKLEAYCAKHSSSGVVLMHGVLANNVLKCVKPTLKEAQKYAQDNIGKDSSIKYSLGVVAIAKRS